MPTLTAPGLYFQPLAQTRASGRLSRGDVPVFLGYARRGPALLPVRVESLTLFEDIFGAAPEFGYLHPALKGFFENGGRTAYVIRLVPESAHMARAKPGNGWIAEASFNWNLVDPRERRRSPRPDETTWVQLIEDIFRRHGHRTRAPGVWANSYELRIARNGRARTQTIPELLEDPAALWLHSLAGVEASSVLALSQTRDGTTYEATAVVTAVDPARQQVRISPAVPDLRDAEGKLVNFAPDQPIRVHSVEFDVEIWAGGRREQGFHALSPHPEHSASVARTMAQASRSVALFPADENAGNTDWGSPASWPPEGIFALSGGSDGLEDIHAADYLTGLDQIAKLHEVAMIAAPDLMLQAQEAGRSEALPPGPVDCCDLEPPALGKLLVRVIEERPDGIEQPLGGVEVDVLAPDGRTRTNSHGIFSASGVPLGLATVRLAKNGYVPVEAVVVAEAYPPIEPVTLTMSRIALPRALPENDVLGVIAAMRDPARVGPYKVAIIDPPHAHATFDDLRRWRARLGDSDRMALFAPWLRLPSTDAKGDGGIIPCPPSGHVCGLFAAAELQTGVHRSGANLPMRHAEGVLLDIDEASHGILNPAGINVLRNFPGRGVRLYGTRTLSSAPEWRYLTARRVVDAIAKTLERNLHWVVFEPNNLMTRHAVARSASVFLERVWRDGVLAGSTPEEAFSVKCDSENNPDHVQDAGQLVIDIGLAPTTPFEFILFRLGSAFDALKVTEAA